MRTGRVQRENKKCKDRKRTVFGSDGKHDRELKFPGDNFAGLVISTLLYDCF